MIEERCQYCLKHVLSALKCLQESKLKNNASSSNSPIPKRHTSTAKDHEEPQMAKPFQPIPMPYSPINSVSKNEEKTPTDIVVQHSEKVKSQLTVSIQKEQYCVATWSDKLNVLLLNKAALVYLILANESYNDSKFGCSLRYIKLSLHSWQAMCHKLGNNCDYPVPCQALTLAGDIYFRLFKSWNSAPSHVDDFNAGAESQKEMLDMLEKIVPIQDSSWMMKVPCDVEESITLSKQKLEAALIASSDSNKITISRMLGDVCNEIATLYMNSGIEMCELGVDMKNAQELWKKSASALSQGIDLFSFTDDKSNLALLHSNSGKLLRVCAFYCVPAGQPRFYSPQEKHYYDQAIQEYKTAIEILKPHKKYDQSIWNLVNWEYCTTLYNMGSIIQEYPPPSHRNQQETMREVVDIFSKALKVCDLKTNGIHSPMYQYRAGVIYKKLADMYHSSAMNNRNDIRTTIRLADRYYSDASKIYLTLDENFYETLYVHLQHVGLHSLTIKDTKNIKNKIKVWFDSLELLLKCRPTLKGLQSHLLSKEVKKDTDSQSNSEVKQENKKECTNDDSSNEKNASGTCDKNNTNNFNEIDLSVLIAFEKKIQSLLISLLTASKSVKT